MPTCFLLSSVTVQGQILRPSVNFEEFLKLDIFSSQKKIEADCRVETFKTSPKAFQPKYTSRFG